MHGKLCHFIYVTFVCSQFRYLVSISISNLTSLNLHGFWPYLNDCNLLSLGKRLGRVNLTTRAAALYCSDISSTLPLSLLRREVDEKCFHQINSPIVSNLSTDQYHYSFLSLTKMNPNEPNSMCVSPTRSRSSELKYLTRRVRTISSNGTLTLDELRRNLDENYLVEDDLHPDEEDNNDEIEGLGNPKIRDEGLESVMKFYLGRSRLRRLDMSWCGNYSQVSCWLII